ncbi:extracellular solute-binding protein [Streptomyces sp. NPDC006367]|uniref:extracellular solute-binding protein n=1 Tax=unclassified Streptomyces TaxID=2593676 RepID=UPI0033A9F02D
MLQRITRTGIAVAALLATTAACGLSGSSDDSASGSEKVGNCAVDERTVGDAPLKGQVKGKITFQTTNLKKDFAGYFEPVIDAFEKQHPGTEIEWLDDPGAEDFTQKLVAKANACGLPDVVNVNIETAMALTRARFLLDFDRKVPGIGASFVPSIWESVEIPGAGGHTVLPWYWAPDVLTYNTELAEKAGLDPDDPPATVLEWLDQAAQVGKRSGGKYHAMLANPRALTIPHWNAMGVEAVADDGKSFVFADDPRVKQWLTKLKELYRSGAMPKDTLASDEDPSIRFSEGKLVWGSPNPSFLRNVQQNSPKLYPKTDVAPYPFAQGASYDGQYITVPKTSGNPATAVAFARFLLNPQNQTNWSKDPKVVVFPTTTESLKDPFFTAPSDAPGAFGKARKVAAEEAVGAELASVKLKWTPVIGQRVSAEFQLAMKGDKSVDQALKDAQEAANTVLEQSK